MGQGFSSPRCAIATVLAWIETLGFCWSCAPPAQSEISQPAFRHTGLQSPTTSVTLKRWAGSIKVTLIHWDDVSRHSCPHCWPEHCRLWQVPGAGEEQNRDRDRPTAWNIYQSPKHLPELLLDNLDTCLKYQCSAFRKKKSWFLCTPKSLFFFFLSAGMQKGELRPSSNKFLQMGRGINIQNPNYIRLGKGYKSINFFRLLNIKIHFRFPQQPATLAPGASQPQHKGTQCDAQGCPLATLCASTRLPQHLASIYHSTSKLWVNNSKPNFLANSTSYNLLFLVQCDSDPKHHFSH